jgi:hypothetical protein
MTVLEFKTQKLAEYAWPIARYVLSFRDLALSEEDWSRLNELMECYYFPARFAESCRQERGKFKRCVASLKYFYRLFNLRKP